jgi:hypothetical protein
LSDMLRSVNEMGFKHEELSRFPFLMSPLSKKETL